MPESRLNANKHHRDRARRNAAFVASLKESTPCTDCKRFYPSFVMDYDHLRDKVMPVSRLAKYGALSRIKEEIAKCELVCSNCHRMRTHKRARVV